VSRLFNALEQIRRNETYSTSNTSKAPVSDTGQGLNAKLIVLIVTALAAMVFLLVNLPTLKNIDTPIIEKPDNISQISITQQSNNIATKTNREKIEKILPIVDINNQGADLVSAHNYWQGIHLLKEASETEPGRIEPLINLGVALAELGLFGPANRYFNMAYGLDPNHPELQKNLVILRDAGLLDKALSFYMEASNKWDREN